MKKDFKKIYDIMVSYSDLISDYMCDNIDNYRIKVGINPGLDSITVYYETTEDEMIHKTKIPFEDLEYYKNR